jgi:hypothetical protein
VSSKLEPIRAPRTRWLALGAVALILSPFACTEALYRAGLQLLPPPPTAPAALPDLAAEVAWVALRQSGPRALRPRWPWDSVLSIARALGGERVPLCSADCVAGRQWALEGRLRPLWRWNLGGYSAAVWMSRHFSADEALAYWLSRAWFADGVRGLAVAAPRLLGKPLEQLDAEEMARLLVLAQSPSSRKHPDAWRAARDALLRKLRERGALDEQSLAAALARPVLARP